MNSARLELPSSSVCRRRMRQYDAQLLIAMKRMHGQVVLRCGERRTRWLTKLGVRRQVLRRVAGQEHPSLRLDSPSRRIGDLENNQPRIYSVLI
jgi:hypothetical protein